MTTAVKPKVPMAGEKRKAETIKAGSSKRWKKPKIDSMQSLISRGEPKRPEKNNTIARRIISSALEGPVSNKAEKLAMNGTDREKGAKVPKAQVIKARDSNADSNDDDFDGFEEDGGVTLDVAGDSDEAEESLPTVQQGVHPDRIKANGNGSGPNGTVPCLKIYSFF